MLEQHPVWDQDALLTRMRGKTDRVVKLVKLFLSDMPQQLNALKTQTPEEMQAIAHTIKGVSANLGVLRLQSRAAALEQAVINAEGEKTKHLLLAIEDSFQESEKELQAFLLRHR